MKIRCALGCLLTFLTAQAIAQCHPQMSDNELLSWRENEFLLAGKAAFPDFAMGLLGCLGHPNPAVRDGVVYEGLSRLLREGRLPSDRVEALFLALLEMVRDTTPDPENFRKPFAALVLSEVVRVDRITPYLTSARRQDAVMAIAYYMQQIDDYRGFDDTQGWRHGVAHGADVILQLALNKQLSKTQLITLLGAVEVSLAPEQHFYIYGEPSRLARAVIYLLLRDELDLGILTDYLRRVGSPAPLSSWRQAYSANRDLARLHNTRGFFYALLALLGDSSDARSTLIRREVLGVLGTFG